MKIKLTAWRMLAVVALAVCGVILADYSFSSPSFCGFRSGCDDVIFSAYSRPLGIPLPVVSIIAFGVFFGLSLLPAHRLFPLVGLLAILAGLTGLALILVQVLVLRRICPLCLLVDACALGLAAIELAGSSTKTLRPALSRTGQWAWTGVAVTAVAAPLLWAALRPAQPVPEQVKAHWVAGKLTVVEITDFDCKHCREAHPVVTSFVKRHGDRLHFVRLVLPLPTHANARPAGRAYLAAEAQGKGEEMADALFEAADRSAAGCRRLAELLGLDMKEYDQVVNDQATDAQLDATAASVTGAGLRGLPLTWVQDRLVFGVPTSAVLEAALQRAKRAGNAKPGG